MDEIFTAAVDYVVKALSQPPEPAGTAADGANAESPAMNSSVGSVGSAQSERGTRANTGSGVPQGSPRLAASGACDPHVCTSPVLS